MPRSPLIRSLAAALATLLLVATSFVLAQDGDPVLIELGSQRERASTVLERFDIAVRGLAAGQGMPVDDALYEQVYPFLPQFLEQRASELVLLEQARYRGITADEAAVEAVLDQARAQYPEEAEFEAVFTEAGFRDLEQLRAVIRETELVEAVIAAIEDEIVLSELEVRVAYESLKPQLLQPAQVCARHILVDDEAQAEQLAEELRSGADFSALAEASSTDRGSAQRGGELGCFARGAMVPEFEQAAFDAEVGVVAGPVQSQFGFHLILVDEVVAPAAPTLEEVREPLEQQLRGERVQSTVDAYVAASGVETYPERIPALEELLGDD